MTNFPPDAAMAGGDTGAVHRPGKSRLGPLNGIGPAMLGGASVPFTYNLTKSNTSHLRAAFKANARNTLVAFMGDSTMRGVDETALPYNTQYAVGAMPMQLAGRLNTSGIISGANNWYGISGTSLADYTTRDSRVLATGGAAFNVSSVPVQGGAEIEFPTATSGWAFTPLFNTTTCDIYYQDSTAGRQFTWQVDGGSATTITTVGSNTIVKLTIPLGAAGIHTILLTWVAQFIRIYGIDCCDASGGRKEMTMRQWGISGGTTSDMIANTGTPSSGRLQQLALYPPDMVISECGLINSWRNNRSVVNSQADMLTLVQAVLATGVTDFVFLTPPYDNSNTGNAANQNDYVAAMYAVAQQTGVGLIDIRKKWLSYANSVANGWQVITDAVHPTAAGYLDEANVILPVIQYSTA